MENIFISNNKENLDISFIHQFLTNSYWANGRTFEQVKQSIDRSICYGLYKGKEQIGFARIISDTVVFAYLIDVFVVENERYKGYASKLMNYILKDETFRDVAQWYLKTKDAHQFYKTLGFNKLQNEEWFMEKIATF